jgi:hypothetical protein
MRMSEVVEVRDNVSVRFAFGQNQKVDLGRAVYMVKSYEDAYHPELLKVFHRLEDAVEYASAYLQDRKDKYSWMDFDMFINQEMIAFDSCLHEFDDDDDEE